jgi:TPR repeat protein
MHGDLCRTKSMIRDWRTIHIFVSSTFNDMHAERDHLRHVVFPELAQRLRARRVYLQEVDLRWGVDTLSLDEEIAREQKILTYCLDEARRCAPHILILLGDRYGYVPTGPDLATSGAAGSDAPCETDGRSVTELEVDACLSATGQPPRHRAFLRDDLAASGLPRDLLARYSDAASGDMDRASRLVAFRQRLKAIDPARCATYALGYEGERPREADIRAFGERVRDAVWQDLDAATRARVVATSQDAASQHRNGTADVIAEARRIFAGRAAIVDELAAFCTAVDGPNVQLRKAPSGSGKTSLIAVLADRLAATGTATLVHFIGAPGSDTLAAMLRVSCDRLAALAGADSVPADADHQALVDGFAALLDGAAARQRVVVLLDALDRLERSPEAQGMAWVPKHWPANARLIATATDGAEATSFAVRIGIGPTPLPALSPADARDVVRHLSALERRQPAAEVVDALLQVQGPGAGPAAGNPLWLVLAFGQLSRLPGRYYRLTAHRLETRAEDRLVGLLRDWVARLPGEPMALFAAILNEAEAHIGADVRILATVLALARRGWRESDIAALLAARTRRAWLPLDLTRLRAGLHGALQASGEGLWRFAHNSLAKAAADEGMVASPLTDFHSLIAQHLASLDPGDLLRRSELVHHALAAGAFADAAAQLAHELGREAEALAEDLLVQEITAIPVDDVGAAWPGRLLWAGELEEGRRLLLAERLWRAASVLMRRSRWQHAAALFKLLDEAYAGKLGTLLERRDAQFQQARLARERAACAHALGDLEQTLHQLGESAQRAGALVQTADLGDQPGSYMLDAATGRQVAHVFHRPVTVERKSEWCNLWLYGQLMAADVMLEAGAFRDADFLLVRLLTMELDIPEGLRTQLHQHQPMRGRGVMAQVRGARAFFHLLSGSGNAAIGDLRSARSALAPLLDILPNEMPLRREAVLLTLRMGQAQLLASAPGSATIACADAVAAYDALCRDVPTMPRLRLERAHALRCLAEGWRRLGRPDLAGAADNLAAQDIRTSVVSDASDPTTERALAWADGMPPVDASLAELLAATPPEPDYQVRASFTGEDAVKEAQAQDPAKLETWRQFIADGPRAGDLLPEIRRADFAFRQALATQGVDALMDVIFTITDPQGQEHVGRDFKPGAARQLGIDGEELLAAVEQAAADGDSRAQLVLGDRLLSGALGPDREHEGAALLERAVEAGSTEAAILLGAYLLASPYGRVGWARGVALLERAAEGGDVRAQSAISGAYLYGRGVPKDPAKAMACMERAAEAGDPAAAYNLGTHLQAGEILPQDTDAAMRWYEMAAERGVLAAKINKAVLLLQRHTGPYGRLAHDSEDVAHAEALLEEAVAAGDTAAMVTLADHLIRPGGADAAAERARKLYERAMSAGRAEAFHSYGWLLLTGLGGERDLEKGLELLQQAERAGDRRATMLLRLIAAATRPHVPRDQLDAMLDRIGFPEREKGYFLDTIAAMEAQMQLQFQAAEASDGAETLYRRGVHLSQEARPPDYAGARACYERAAAFGHTRAMHNLAHLYLQGQGVEQDAATALEWMRRAAEGGEAMAQYHMGVFLSEGKLLSPAAAEAVGWYRRAAAQGLPMAMHNLAWCYLQGVGLDVDLEQALTLFRQAAAAGQAESAPMIEYLEALIPPNPS